MQGTRKVLGLVMLAWLSAGQAPAMNLDEREALDLSAYTVTDPDASYFDVEARMALLNRTRNPLLQQQSNQLSYGMSCRQVMDIPPLEKKIRIPGFYPSPEEWRFASGPLIEFEDVVSNLAGSFVASGEPYYAKCLVEFLDHWASRDALMDFFYTWQQPQAWFSTESMIFSAAMAYSIVRPAVEGMAEEKQRIDAWLNRLAHQHSAIPGHQSSCCNNHFYRRALYATAVGILTQDDELFRFGVSAVYSALSDLLGEGALRLEMKRGRRASHYQNYALLYLIPNMQLIARQGYDVFDLEVNGHTIHDAVDFALDTFEDPSALGDFAPHEQYKGFLKDDQYFAWMEIYQSRFDDPRIAEFLKPYRPIYNRGAGGYVTMYFMDPEDQQRAVLEERRQQRQEEIWQAAPS
ncbi:MAG: alginate lyase family protein [Halomonas sp.]|nr:alginate lyase family protein [Halomonas sp.]